MSKSILQSEKECFITRRTTDLHQHHIFAGHPRRAAADANGFWVYLVSELHNLSNYGVHFNKEFDTWLKKRCQAEFEKTHSREEFIAIMGMGFLDDNEYVPEEYDPYYRKDLNVHGFDDDWFGSNEESDDWF